MYGLIKRISWLVIALACVCVGLKACCNVDIAMMLHLKRFNLMMRYLVGICGAGSLVMFFVERSLGNCCKN